MFQVENRYHSAGRARRFFHSITRNSSCVVPRLFAIVAEQQRKQLIDAALGYLPSSHSLLHHIRQMSPFFRFFFPLQILFHWLCRSCGPCVALPTLPENGLSNRIRGLFENIVSKEAGSRCPLIWRMYMHFLVRLRINLMVSRMQGLVYICSSLFIQSYLTAAATQALYLRLILSSWTCWH